VDGLGPRPTSIWSRVATLEQIKDPKPYKEDEEKEVYNAIGGGDNSFPHEYSVSGWFRWSPHDVVPWRLVFRFTINEKAINMDHARLGDRTLSVWMGQNAFFYWTTYSYTDLNGNGKSDINSGN